MELVPIFMSSPQEKENSFEEVKGSECTTPYKKRKIRGRAESIISKIHKVCELKEEKLSSVFA